MEKFDLENSCPMLTRRTARRQVADIRETVVLWKNWPVLASIRIGESWVHGSATSLRSAVAGHELRR